MKILFWAVDCQNDFMNKDGALYVEGAEAIKSNLKKLTSIAINYNIPVVNTRDWHEATDEELSETPDFINTFPKHCMKDTKGAEFIKEITPIYGNTVVINKNKFDVFTGSKNTEKILKDINPNIVVVYGVATNVCVNFAILGLVGRGYKVIVVYDAIKELPNLPVNEIYKDWKTKGVTFEITADIEKIIKYWKI